MVQQGMESACVSPECGTALALQSSAQHHEVTLSTDPIVELWASYQPGVLAAHTRVNLLHNRWSRLWWRRQEKADATFFPTSLNTPGHFVATTA